MNYTSKDLLAIMLMLVSYIYHESGYIWWSYTGSAFHWFTTNEEPVTLSIILQCTGFDNLGVGM